MAWWTWIIIGLAFLAGEVLLTGGFDLLFFSIAALIVGGLLAFDVVMTTPAQLLLFSVLAVVSLVLFRKRLVARFKLHGSAKELDNLVGESVTLLTDVATGGRGKGELRGSTWNVRSAIPTDLVKGQRAVVDRVDGLTLWIKPE